MNTDEIVERLATVLPREDFTVGVGVKKDEHCWELHIYLRGVVTEKIKKAVGVEATFHPNSMPFVAGLT
jgi:hypothetical protein